MKLAASFLLKKSQVRKHQVFLLGCLMMLLGYPVCWAWAAGAFSIFYIWPMIALLIAVFVTYHASKEPSPANWFAVAAFQVAWIVACYLVWTISFTCGWLGFPVRQMGLASLEGVFKMILRAPIDMT